MRTIKTKAYKLSELRTRTARERAFKDYQDQVTSWGDVPWQEELLDSLKAVFKASNVKLKDWELGAYCYSHLEAEFQQEETAELSGARAAAWLENYIFGPLRARHGLPEIENGKPLPKGYYKNGDKLARWTKPGEIPSCPLTGYCMDETFLDALRAAVKDGDTLKEAFEGLADVYQEALESEDEYQRSEEAFKDRASMDGWEFEHDGRRIA